MKLRAFPLRCAVAAIVCGAVLASVPPAGAQRVTLAPPARSPGELAATPPSRPSDIGLGSAGNPALDYTLHCQGCHRADGSGTPGAIPALAGSVARFLKVPGGREYLSRVPGAAQATLEDAELAALLNWIVVRFDAPDVPADFKPYAAAEVGALRREPLVRVDAERSRLLAELDVAADVRTSNDSRR